VKQSEEILPPEARARVGEIGRADIVVGIPSYNNAGTIAHVVRAAQAGLAKYFPDLRSAVLNSDGGSHDGTRDVVQQTALGDAQLLLVSYPLFPIHRLTFPYRGIPGKGSAFRCIFRAAELLGARACAVVDSDLRSITPEWMQLLIAPVLEHGFDYVAPYYLRHKYDGTITNSIVYPMTRALYGVRVRQPIGGDFGLSGRLVSHYLTKDVWDTHVARYGIDIWMTTTAVCEDFRVCQSFLGAKIHDAKDPGADLSDMLVQVVGTVFSLMETYEPVWSRVEASRETPMVGFRFGVGLEPVTVDVERMIGRFRTGVEHLSEIWATTVSPPDVAALRAMASLPACAFRFDDGLWVRIVYDLACAFHRRVIDREHLVRASLPLYMGWVASFVQEVATSDAEQVDARIEALARAFESEKGYLRQRWQGRETARAQPRVAAPPQ
jgi:glycosyltransferase involved in cell wall biosynthesis